MNKLFLGLLIAVTTFFLGAAKAFAEIPGRYLAADLSAADLTDLIRKYPILFRILFIVFVIFCIGYAFYWIKKPKE